MLDTLSSCTCDWCLTSLIEHKCMLLQLCALIYPLGILLAFVESGTARSWLQWRNRKGDGERYNILCILQAQMLDNVTMQNIRNVDNGCKRRGVDNMSCVCRLDAIPCCIMNPYQLAQLSRCVPVLTVDILIDSCMNGGYLKVPFQFSCSQRNRFAKAASKDKSSAGYFSVQTRWQPRGLLGCTWISLGWPFACN